VVILSKILSYIFALVVIFTTGNIIFSIAVVQENVADGDWLLIFCLLLIMLMGIYFIVNDLKNLRSIRKKTAFGEEGILDDELVSK
jgi:hypothetical protein